MTTVKIKTLLVRDLMHIGVPTCPASTSLGEAVSQLLRNKLETLVVLDEHGHGVGLFGRREGVVAFVMAKALDRPLDTLTVADLMRPHIPEVPPDIPVTAAVQLMLDQNVRALYLMHHHSGIRFPAAVLRYEDVLGYLTGEKGLESDE